MPHPETHKVQHIGLLRAAVLGANDGILSTASLLLGVVASGAGTQMISRVSPPPFFHGVTGSDAS